MTGQFSATASLIGYLFQVRYALLVVLQKLEDYPDIEVSLEKLDDIAFESNGEALQLLQTKHNIRHRATLGNASGDIWKTIRVWSSYISTNINISDSLDLLLITTSEASENSIASKLRRNKDRDVDYACAKLKEVADNYLSNPQSPERHHNRSAYMEFSSLSENQKKSLISKITVIDKSPSILDVERQLERKVSLWSRHAQSFKSRLEGWWFSVAINHLTDDTSTVSVPSAAVLGAKKGALHQCVLQSRPE